MNGMDDGRDPAMSVLSRLTTYEPDAARAARSAARCRTILTALAARRPSPARLAPRAVWLEAIEPILVASASAVFLFEVLSRATHLYR